MSEAQKAGRGRPKGKKVSWTGIVWHAMTNKDIAEKVGTSVPNVWQRRKKGIEDGKQMAYKGPKYRHSKALREASAAAKKAKTAKTTPPVAAEVAA